MCNPFKIALRTYMDNIRCFLSFLIRYKNVDANQEHIVSDLACFTLSLCMPHIAAYIDSTKIKLVSGYNVIVFVRCDFD